VGTRRRAVEGVVMVDPTVWRDRRVLVTGHTGFKGGWLSHWLAALGARVAGYALDPPTRPSFFETAGVADLLQDHRGDVRDAREVARVVEAFRPEVVFHLAAQSLVLDGYRDPVGTYATNVVGTASVLDACRTVPEVRAIVVITTDKCYENRNWVWGYREDDRLGGFDPYSSSKACAELVCDAYRGSFLGSRQPTVGLATARAGNVIGGGDWAADRLIPDLVRSVLAGTETVIRHPDATRPWQHVLEPLSGYLMLAERVLAEPRTFSDAWNFGPDAGGDATVRTVIDGLAAHWPGGMRWTVERSPQAHEAQRLMLDSSKARARLAWRPRLGLDEALRLTGEWYRAAAAGGNLRELTQAQIGYYSQFAESSVSV